ncbi:hypothetical protein [Candidatus Harpocratesius sp.]
MNRILIIGSGGAGKSVFARRLGKLLELPVFHLDCYFWQPNWKQTPKEEWISTLDQILHYKRWIIDGNYSSTLEKRLMYADTVIYLDFPRRICIYRVIKRQTIYRNHPRYDITTGCKERIDFEFLKWIWRFRKERSPYILKLLNTANLGQLSVYRFTSPRQLSKWLQNLSKIR